MSDNNVITISSILDYKKFGHKILFLPLLKPEIEDIFEMKPLLLTKIKKVIKNIKLKFPLLICFSLKKFHIFKNQLHKSRIHINLFFPFILRNNIDVK